VESTPGQGSLFSFDVAALVAHYEGSASGLGGKVIGYDGPRKSVLVVDDIDANRFVLADTLRLLGFEIEQAINGLEALRAVQSNATDLVLMDVRMPVMDGLEAMRQMRQHPKLCQIPIITVSAGVATNERDECLEAGAKAFLTKPIDEANMLKQIGSVLGLTWIKETMQQTPRVMNDPGEQFVLPEPDQMESLHDLAKAGNMRAISEKAESLAARDARYRPFADQVTQLARGFQSKALLHMMEKHVAQQQEGQAQ
jgi:CheY-like chemotaxis protein